MPCGRSPAGIDSRQHPTTGSSRREIHESRDLPFPRRRLRVHGRARRHRDHSLEEHHCRGRRSGCREDSSRARAAGDRDPMGLLLPVRAIGKRPHRHRHGMGLLHREAAGQVPREPARGGRLTERCLACHHHPPRSRPPGGHRRRGRDAGLSQRAPRHDAGGMGLVHVGEEPGCPAGASGSVPSKSSCAPGRSRDSRVRGNRCGPRRADPPCARPSTGPRGR